MSELWKQSPTAKFDGKATVYANSRPGYPEQAIDFIISRCRLNEKSVLVDIGSGTGISSLAFAKKGIRVLGIEPNADMRYQAGKLKSQHDDISLEFLSGVAESTGLADASADCVLAAQSFHWFEPEKTLVEFHRILKPNAFAVLMWNWRDPSHPFSIEYNTIMHNLNEPRTVQMNSDSGVALQESALFQDYQMTKFDNEQILDREGVIRRASSSSFFPAMGAEKNKAIEQLERAYHEHERNGVVAMRYHTLVYTAQRKG